MMTPMNGTPISLVRTVPLRCDPLVPLVRSCLHELDRHAKGGELELAADVRGTGRVAVPVVLRTRHVSPQSRRFEIALSARRAAALFPRFEGRLDLAPADSDVASTAISLSGAYVVPLGAVGRAIDGTIARGIAASGLSSLLERLVADVLARVANEADRASRSAHES